MSLNEVNIQKIKDLEQLKTYTFIHENNVFEVSKNIDGDYSYLKINYYPFNFKYPYSLNEVINTIENIDETKFNEDIFKKEIIFNNEKYYVVYNDVLHYVYVFKNNILLYKDYSEGDTLIDIFKQAILSANKKYVNIHQYEDFEKWDGNMDNIK